MCGMCMRVYCIECELSCVATPAAGPVHLIKGSIAGSFRENRHSKKRVLYGCHSRKDTQDGDGAGEGRRYVRMCVMHGGPLQARPAFMCVCVVCVHMYMYVCVVCVYMCVSL